MEPNSSPTDIFPRIEPEELRERRNALKLKTCPFCGIQLSIGKDARPMTRPTEMSGARENL